MKSMVKETKVAVVSVTEVSNVECLNVRDRMQIAEIEGLFFHLNSLSEEQ